MLLERLRPAIYSSNFPKLSSYQYLYSFRQQRFPKYSSMSSVNRTNGSPARKLILVVSISRHLHGVPIEKGIESEWAKEKARDIKDSFENVGFNLDPKDVPTALRDLKHELEGRPWDGIIIGWCIRGNNDFTILFEKVVGACCEVIKSAPETKLMFSSGPQNIVETVARNFAVDGTA
ncbi:uncharacterized protein LY89DRAFT_782629 [Mollisia scopiformis]|uniref:Uncharacterized protein n=1 Tax=Mollisia scopiformis TaxID=149040 RepID=A0A194X9A1_MOLSC|nr:uncharacterized protein LY89DRAFT_782629 [Mollisia scopiformis]KUJ16362.1 hypothetical protein LY89DRAFT_782629 [Mollisia scopiformis]